MSPLRDVAPKDGVTPIFPNASLVADLAGWNGAVLTQPWYCWLSPEDVLVRGGADVSDAIDGFKRPAAGQEGLLYRIGVRSKNELFGPLARQRPVPLVALSRRAQSFGGLWQSRLSPDGRWLLYLGNHRRAFYWCAASIDGNNQVAWRMNLSKTPLIDVPRPAVALSDATWLPDSTGILETNTEWDQFNSWNTTVAGRVWNLNSPDSAMPFRSTQLGKITESQCSYLDLGPVQMIGGTGGRTVALHPRCCSQKDDPNLASGGPLQSRPQDQLVVYRWDWRLGERRSPTVQRDVVAMPTGYSLIANAVAVGGDRVVFALMDRAHHYVVSTGGKIHPRHGDGKISMWTCEMSDGRTNGLRERSSFVVPFGKEAWCYQRFGLGDWLPGNRRFSFQFASNLYTVAA